MSPSAATRVEWARRLAQALVSGGYATEPAVNAVLDESSSVGASFTSLLIQRGVAAPDIVVGVLSQMTQLHVVDLNRQAPFGRFGAQFLHSVEAIRQRLFHKDMRARA